MQEHNYNKFVYEAQKMENVPKKKKKQNPAKLDRGCKSQVNFEDPKNLKKQLK